jgi:predicted nucleic acid-binding protein
VIWALDSSPLIYLNKVGLQDFTYLEGEKIIPPQVYRQVVADGKMRGEADALVTEELVERGVLRVVEVENGFMKTLKSMEAGLHESELEVLALAKSRNGIAILDESIARDTATILGIGVYGTLFLIFLMVRREILKREEAKDKVNSMIKKGFRLGHEEYLKFLELLQSSEDVGFQRNLQF